MAYLLDSNCYIEPRNNFYAMDICPGYWDWMVRENKAGVLYSIDRIRQELVPGKNDDITEWAKARDETFFLPALTDNDVIAIVTQITDWLETQVRINRYERRVVDDFLRGADPYLIAFAKKHGHIVVTQEAHKTEMKKKVGITIVCNQFGVQWMHLLDLLRERGPKFILEPEKTKHKDES